MTDEPIGGQPIGGSAGTRCGFIAIIGAPNVGKSTLVNRLVGTKVTIVSPKVQTTRSRVMGIAIEGEAQLVFVDTPGIFAPKRRLDRAMVRAAWSGAADGDVVLLVVDARGGLDEGAQGIVDKLIEQKRRAILALNKIDLIDRTRLLPAAAAFEATGIFDRIFMISAKEGYGVVDLRRYITAAMPPGPWHFPEDQITDMPQRLWAAEVTREKIFLRLHQELPYAIAVETTAWTERDDGSVRIDQTILVAREQHRSMVLGSGGKMVKEVGTLARKELEEGMECRVHLFLTVEHRPNWQEDRHHYTGMGLDFDV